MNEAGNQELAGIRCYRAVVELWDQSRAFAQRFDDEGSCSVIVYPVHSKVVATRLPLNLDAGRDTTDDRYWHYSDVDATELHLR